MAENTTPWSVQADTNTKKRIEEILETLGCGTGITKKEAFVKMLDLIDFYNTDAKRTAGLTVDLNDIDDSLYKLRGQIQDYAFKQADTIKNLSDELTKKVTEYTTLEAEYEKSELLIEQLKNEKMDLENRLTDQIKINELNELLQANYNKLLSENTRLRQQLSNSKKQKKENMEQYEQSTLDGII